MEETALLDREQEDEPVDEAQELLEVGGRRKRPALKGRAQRSVVRVAEETLAEGDQRFLEAPSQVLAGARPLLAPGFAPGLERAIRRWPIGAAETRLVSQQPECPEVGIALLREDSRQVGFDPRRPREACVVAQDA